MTSTDTATEATTDLPDRLAAVWAEFEDQLAEVPILRALEAGEVEIEDYLRLLHNLRQQVVDGSLWIARAASNFDTEHLELRSAAMTHAVEEHRDHLMLEQDFVAVGGSREALRAGRKNIGSQALSGYLFHQASQPNPVACLGAMFIIEGLGALKALAWAERFQEVLGLAESQVHFLRYHQEADAEHTGAIEPFLMAQNLSAEQQDAIVSCARVVARLYALQLTVLDEV